MQLSWIDPDALRELTAKLSDLPKPPPVEPVVHKLAVDRATEANLLGMAPDAPGTATPEAADQPVVPAEDLQVARIRAQLQQIRSKALQAGLISAPAPPPAPAAPVVTPTAQEPMPASPALKPLVEERQTQPPKVPTIDVCAPVDVRPLGERLDQFAQWASERVSADELLLVDDHGDVLWGTSLRSDLALTALLSLNAALRSSAGVVIKPPAIIRNQLSSDRELTVLPCPTRHGTVTLAILNARHLQPDSVDMLRENLVKAVEGGVP